MPDVLKLYWVEDCGSVFVVRAPNEAMAGMIVGARPESRQDAEFKPARFVEIVADGPPAILHEFM